MFLMIKVCVKKISVVPHHAKIISLVLADMALTYLLQFIIILGKINNENNSIMAVRNFRRF